MRRALLRRDGGRDQQLWTEHGVEQPVARVQWLVGEIHLGNEPLKSAVDLEMNMRWPHPGRTCRISARFHRFDSIDTVVKIRAKPANRSQGYHGLQLGPATLRQRAGCACCGGVPGEWGFAAEAVGEDHSYSTYGVANCERGVCRDSSEVRCCAERASICVEDLAAEIFRTANFRGNSVSE
jgi:hypothetical protein